MKKYHDDVIHPGMNTTAQTIKQHYSWVGMYNYIRDYVRTCALCQKKAALPPQLQRKLHPIPPPKNTWVHIGMDLICDLNESQEGYKHILVTVCYLSKYVAARLLKSKTTAEVIENLEDIYVNFGLPKVIQHDQGKEFTSFVFQDFHKKLGIDNRSTCAYHPMANGLVAHNKILKMKLGRMGDQTGEH